MSTLLQEAIERISELPESDQERWARRILAELEDESWHDLLDSSPEALDALIARAEADIAAGRTEVLDPDQL